MHVYASATAAHVGPKRMLALFLDDDRNVGANLAGDRFCGEMEIRGSRDAELNGTGDCFQLPVAVGAWISLDGNASGGRKRLHVLCCTLNLDIATLGVCFDSSTGVENANDPRKGVHAHISPSARDGHTSRGGRYSDIVANVSGGHRPAEGRNLRVALDFFDTDGP